MSADTNEQRLCEGGGTNDSYRLDSLVDSAPVNFNEILASKVLKEISIVTSSCMDNLCNLSAEDKAAVFAAFTKGSAEDFSKTVESVSQHKECGEKEREFLSMLNGIKNLNSEIVAEWTNDLDKYKFRKDEAHSKILERAIDTVTSYQEKFTGESPHQETFSDLQR